MTSSPSGINCGTTCSGAFADGTPVTLTAAPATGSTFVGFSGAGCSGTGPCTVMLNSDQTVTATFTSTVPTNRLTVTQAGTGSGRVTSTPKGIDCGPTCSANFNTGTVVKLTAKADPGSTFPGFSGAGCSGTGPCTVTLTSDQTVTATFAALLTRPTVSAVSPSSGPTSGGTAITVTGTGFVPGASVVIGQGHGATSGAIPATNVVVVSPTQITPSPAAQPEWAGGACS